MTDQTLETVLAAARESFQAGRRDEAETRLRASTDAFAAIEQQLQAPAPAETVSGAVSHRLRLADDILPLLRIDTLLPQLTNGQPLPGPFAAFFTLRANLPLTHSLIAEFCAELDRQTLLARQSTTDLERLSQRIAAEEARVALLSRFVLLFRMQALAEDAKPGVFERSLSDIAEALGEFRPLAIDGDVRSEAWLECERSFGELLDALRQAARARTSPSPSNHTATIPPPTS